jgi:hypothetical protein
MPTIARVRRLTVAAALMSTACAPGTRTVPQPATSAPGELLAVQRAWWTAFTLADTAALARLTAPVFRLTLSSGRTFDRTAALAESARYTTGNRLTLTWTDEAAHPLAGGDVVLVTARMGEAERQNVAHYRYATILERDGMGTWRVAAAQSTRELEPAARIWSASAVGGDLSSYAGRYRVPSGAVLAIAVQDSALALTDPNGAVLRLEPIGPGLFEEPRLSASNGLVRFAFARDAAGRVISINRLIPSGVNTFPRVTEP